MTVSEVSICVIQNIRYIYGNVLYRNNINIKIRHSLWLVVTLLPVVLPFTINDTFAEPSPPPKTTPVQFHAHYIISKGSIRVAQSRRSLTQISAETFAFESETQSVGVAKLFSNARIHERSVWSYHGGKITPLEYSYKNSSEQNKRHVQLVFDWDKHIITNIINGSPWTMATQPSVKDKLLYQIQLMLDLANPQPPEALTYLVADGGRIKSYQLTIHPQENLVINGTNYETVRVSRAHKGRTTTFWCATKLQYIPVKILQEKQGGSLITATLEKLEILTAKPD